MSTASTASHSIRDAAKDTAKDAREGVRDMGRAAAEASGSIEDDLQRLREDFSRLAEQVAGIFNDKSSAAWQRARSSVDDVVSDARARGREAADAVREVSDSFVDAVDESLKNRPYTTLAIAGALGFLFGVAWRR